MQHRKKHGLLWWFIKTRFGLRDPLTGLRSRMAYETTLIPPKGAVIIADANGLKKLNDEHGYEHGDLLLQRIGEFIRHLIAKNASRAFRIGGDEFVIITESWENGEQLLKEIKRSTSFNLAAGIAPIEGNFAKVFRLAEVEMRKDKKAKKKKKKA